MRFEGFIGPAYDPSAYSVDSQKTTNWYTEKTERQSTNGFAYSLLRTPGRKLFCDPGVGAATVRAEYALDNHLFAVVGDKVIESFSDGTSVVYGTVVDDGKPAHIAGNPTQLFIVSGGNGYILAGSLSQIVSPGFPTGQALGAAMIDQYFVTALAGTQEFGISALGDGTNWDADRRGAAEASPDFILQIGVLGNELWPFGSQTIEIFEDTGDLDFPFEPRQDITIPKGIYAPESLVEAGGSWYFLAGNQRGHGMFARIAGFTLSRVSDHGVENTVRKMDRSDDAVGWTYEENGHIFVCWYFPTADKTLCYDVSTDQWHQRTWLSNGVEHAHRAYCAADVFGKTIVGDRIDGKLYEMGIDILDDAGDDIRRTRRAPCIDDELLNVVHGNFVLDGNMGIGMDGTDDPDDPVYDPKAMLRWSNTGGKDGSFGQEHWRGFGRVGELQRRAIWRRLGYARRRVYELVVSAPVDWAISGCYVNMRTAKRSGGRRSA